MASKVLVTVALASPLLLASGAQAGDWYRRDYQPRTYTNGEYCEPKEEVPVPEPSAALVFGAGLLVASRLARKRR